MPSLSEETHGAVKMLQPGATIGIIGGGQLGRMMALSAKYMGFRIGVLDPTPDCPTAQVADFQVVGEYDDKTAIHDLAEKSDVLTYEFENVDAESIDEVRHLVAAPQGTDLLRVTQDRIHEKTFINRHGIETAPWREVNTFEELDAAIDDLHYPCVLKTRSGGYDGHGQHVLRNDSDLEKIRARGDRGGGFPPSILEGFVDFAFEASILVSGNGKDYVTFPIVRNDHRNNILHMTIAPAEVSPEIARTAHEMALALARGFELAGTLAIELFITKDGKAIAGDGKLIIDDNSPDGTGAIVKDLQKQFPGALHLMERTGKQGLGTAYIAGFKWAIEHRYEYIFEMDADFSHNPKDLMNLLAACKTGGADMAIGSRYVTGVNVVNWPMGRVMMSYFASKYVRFVTGMKIHDTTAGFVCYRRRVLETIGLDSIRFKGYAFQIEMKFTTYKYGFTIKEVPIIFINRVLGESKMNTSIFGEAVFGVIRLKINSWFRKYPKQGN